MIILPDRDLPRGKLLIPVPRVQWRAPSQAQPKDQFGNENQTRFRIRGRTNDGYIAWAGWFDDRDDADAFLWALVNGTLRQEPALWRMPVPNWHPDIWPGLTYEFATVTFLTTTPGSNLTFTSPSDWNNSANTIELIGGGGGAATNGGTNHQTGGGGGEYGKTTNFTFATPGTTTATYRIAASAAKTVAGNDSWWNGTTQAGATLGGKGGGVGAQATGNTSGGTGGTGGVGTTHNAGGRGGNLTGASGIGWSGGGGAGGATGAGNNGGDSALTTNVVTSGGSGDAGVGGGGGATGNPGAAGTEWDATHGSGGGGGGTNGTLQSGGNYGGGEGAGNSPLGSPTGAQGIIVVTYTPIAFGDFVREPVRRTTTLVLKQPISINSAEPPPVTETNTHFVAKFSPYYLARPIPGPNTDYIVALRIETNTHFLATFGAAKFARPVLSTDQAQPPVTETNVHFVTRLNPGALKRPIQSADQASPAVVETNVHFTARFNPAKLNQPVQSADLASPAVAETNPHFIAKFFAPLLALPASIMRAINSIDNSFSAPTADTHDPGPLPIDQHYLDWWKKKGEKKKHKPEAEVEQEFPEPEPDLIPPPPLAAQEENDDDDALALLLLMDEM